MLNRRDIVAALGVLPFTACAGSPERLATEPNTIDSATLQSGDLIWPRDPDKRAVYVMAGTGADSEQDRQAWLETKAEFEARVARGEIQMTAEEIAYLKALTYEQFRRRYDEDTAPSPLVLRGARGGLTVGHVAIVIIENGKTEVVEAVWGSIKKVIRRPYTDFENEHAKDLKWRARLKGRTPEEMHKVALTAAGQERKPYDFWNFNLDSDAGFYCSKLVWFAVYHALGFAIDGNPNPKRGFWFSPKQLLRQPTLDTIDNPGPYLV